MKLLFCTKCSDIRAMDPEGKPTLCRCKQFAAWWENPDTGTVKYLASEGKCAWFIGLHNAMLRPCYGAGIRMTHEEWAQLHETVTTELSTGYIFARTHRNCWAAPFCPEIHLVNGVSRASREEVLAKGDEYPEIDCDLFMIIGAPRPVVEEWVRASGEGKSSRMDLP